MLPDGTYDAIVVDASGSADHLVIELTVLAGAHKGEVVSVNATGMAREPFDLLGVPATLRVAGGVPALDLEG